MSLYALTSAALKGISTTVWGYKIPVTQPDGSVRRMDTGVDEFAQELIARLSSLAPIQQPLLFALPPGVNPIQVITVTGDGDGDPPPPPDPDGFTGEVDVITDVTIEAEVSVDGCDVTLTVTPILSGKKLVFLHGRLMEVT